MMAPEAQLGEAGELWVKGEQVMRGYWQRPEATAEVLKMAGWQRVTSSLWTRAIASVLLTAKRHDLSFGLQRLSK